MPTTTTGRMSLIDQLSLNAARLSKEPAMGKSWSIEHGDIPGVFQRMYDIANGLASRDGLVWLNAKFSQEEILRERRKESLRSKENESESSTLGTELLDFVDARREEYMQRMTALLELYVKSRWAGREEQKKGILPQQ